ncbi:transposase, partial [Francisella tularensis]|nr:transposase [Francisella tularensis]
IPFDSHVYKERHLIENFFSKIKHFRKEILYQMSFFIYMTIKSYC